jgi:small-conductance mechanosensitive channel
VGFGFAMQNITQNFFSGLILLMERSIKPGDILEVDDRMVRVREMGLRSTVARTLDEEDLIIPNAVLVQQTVKNYTLRDNLVRLRATVGVAYGSDLEAVEEGLERACHGLPGLSPGHPPAVLLTGLGDSAVLFEVSVWIENPWASRIVLSQLYKEIVTALGRVGVTIAFPQLDVHLPRLPTPTPSSGG